MTSPGCRCRRRKRWRRFWPTSPRTRSRSWWTGCSPRAPTASGGGGTGWTSSATPTRRAATATSSAPEAWRYRNYVIDSFNADKPYDQFVQEQIAGDLLPAESEEKVRADRRHGVPADQPAASSVAEEFHLTIEDTIDNPGKAVLGLTVSALVSRPQVRPDPADGLLRAVRHFPEHEVRVPRHRGVPPSPGPRAAGAEARLEELRPVLKKMEEMDAEMLLCYSTQAELDTNDPEKGKLKAVRAARARARRIGEEGRSFRRRMRRRRARVRTRGCS